ASISDRSGILPIHLANSGWLIKSSDNSIATPTVIPTPNAFPQLLGRAKPNIFPTHAAQPQRRPSQQEQIRGFAEKDVMVHIGDKQADHNGKLEEQYPQTVTHTPLNKN